MSETDSQSHRYTTYFNYVTGAAALIRSCHPTDNLLGQAMQASSGFQKMNRLKKGFDQERISELLRSSWFTETAILKAQEFPAFLPYSNPWAMVQVYYSVFWATRAYFHATGRIVTRSHNKTLGTLCNDLIACKDRFPDPWCAVVNGDPRVKPLLLSNSTCTDQLTLTNPLISPQNAGTWQHFMLLLKTTRQRLIDDRVTDWKQENKRVRIRNTERQQINSKLRSTSLFDGLYRMRVRSNYRDLDSFALGNMTQTGSRNLHKGLTEILHMTLFTFEMLIARSIGKWHFSRIVAPFLLSPPGQLASGTIGSRWSVVRQYV